VKLHVDTEEETTKTTCKKSEAVDSVPRLFEIGARITAPGRAARRAAGGAAIEASNTLGAP